MSIADGYVTVGQAARAFGRSEQVVRKVVDSMPNMGIERVGLYRLIPRSRMLEIAAKLAERSSRGMSRAGS